MKIIVSHDVDHLYLKEHLTDTFLPGNFYRSFKNLAAGNISVNNFIKRFSGRLNRVKELHVFNKEAGVKETFFFGMRKGLNLSYNWQDARPFVEYLLKEQVLIGMHGMGYNSFKLLQEEMGRLKTMLPSNYPLGIRNHYLRMDDSTFDSMNENGFLFDSTLYNTDKPFLQGKMWEIPISIMDAGFVSNGRNNMEDLKKRTIAKIDEAETMGLPFFVINFHDLYYSDAYPDYKNWYEWLISYLVAAKYMFIDFSQAVQILNERGIHADSLHK